MDKYEYKVRSEEIEKLIKEERYAEAAAIADTIDWRKVKNLSTLLNIAGLYKKNTRNEDCRGILTLAYEKYPTNRTVVFELCDVSIKLYDIVAAMGYFNQYKKIASQDSGVIILKYRILEAQEASIEERIALLEDLKTKNYQEEWAYELAYLYHRIGLATKCAEECDQIVLWFGNGPYVMKALELKMMHMPLTEKQQLKYDEMLYNAHNNYGDDGYNEETYAEDAYLGEMYADGTYSSEGYAEGAYAEDAYSENSLMADPFGEEFAVEGYSEYYSGGYYSDDNFYTEQKYDGSENPVIYEDDVNSSYGKSEVNTPPAYSDSDMSRFNTINIQKVVAEGMMEIFSDSDDIFAEERETFKDDDYTKMIKEADASEEKSEPDTSGIEKIIVPGKDARAIKADTDIEEIRSVTESSVNKEHARMEKNAENVYRDMEHANSAAAEDAPFRPMTGQMSIDDVLSQWENIKLDNVKKHQEEIKKQIVTQTGKIFASFNDSLKNGILEELEKEAESAADELGATRIISREEIKRGLARPQGEEPVVEEERVLEAETALEEGTVFEEKTAPESEQIFEKEAAFEAEAPFEEEQAFEEETAFKEETVLEEETAVEYADEAYEDAQEYYEEAYSEESYEESYSDEYYEDEAYAGERELDPEDEQTIAEMAKEDALRTHEIKLNTADLTDLPDKIVETAERETAGAGREEIREFTAEEQELFENFAVTKKIKKQIIYALDSMTLAAFTGNVIITGERGIDTVRMAKNLIREFQELDESFSGKVAKVTGGKLNQKILKEVFEKIDNGAIIIEKANGMTGDKLYELATLLNQDNLGIVVIMEDTKKEITKLLEKQAMIADYFNIRIDLMEMDNNALVAYARNYALALEYSIDEFGTLALYSRIANIQSGNHVVTKDEVREIIDEAITKSKKFKVKNLVDVLFARRYDSEDMIVLKERDFM